MKKGVRILLIVLMLLISGAAYLYFRIRAGVDSAVNVQKLEDGFYYMEYRDDYGFDRFLEQGGAASDLDVAKFVGKALFKGFLYPRFLGGSFGSLTASATFFCNSAMSDMCSRLKSPCLRQYLSSGGFLKCPSNILFFLEDTSGSLVSVPKRFLKSS